MDLTNEILKERKNGIGGSDCAAVLGLSKWSTPLDIYLSKIDRSINVREQTRLMRSGHKLEPIVIEDYEEKTSQKVFQPDGIFKNPKYPWLLANVDGLIEDKKLIIEAKTTRFFNEDWGDEYTDQIPTEYYIQIAQYCLILEYDTVEVAALSRSDWDFRIYRYTRNKAVEEKIIERTKNFWENNVLKRIPPQPTNGEDIMKLYKKATLDKTLLASDVLCDLAYKHREVKNNIKKLETESKGIENKIKGELKDCSYLVDPDGTKLAAWTNVETSRFNTKKFKEEHNDLYKKYLVPSECRKFLNKIKGGK